MHSLRITELFSDDSLTLFAVESMNFQHEKSGKSCWLYGSVETIAVVICTSDKTYAMDMQANLISLDQLRHDLPELNHFIGPGDEQPGLG